MFRFIDLFAGIGGIRLGFESIGGKCVFTSEINKFAQQTYRANFNDDHEIVGDIRQVHESEIPPHDVLLAGFPCQAFSLAGVSKRNSLGRPHGFRDQTMGTLFFEIARILEYHRPAAFFLENVKNLVNHDKGRTFEIIHRVLSNELGYEVHAKVVSAHPWVPQRRERVYIVGFREPTGFCWDDLPVPSPELQPRLRAILHPEDGSEPPEEPYTHGPYGRVNDKYTLSDKLWEYLQAHAAKHRKKGNGFGYGLFTPDDVARTLSARYYKDGSEILIAQPGRNPRRLTPREAARLMGFDDGRRSDWVIPVSDTQAYRQFGNSVVVPVIRAIAKHMQPHLFAVLHGMRRAA